MLQEMTSASEKAEAQRVLHDGLTAALRSRGQRKISYRGGGGVHPVWSDRAGQLYYSYAAPHSDQDVERHWNAFGTFAENGTLRIVVETNIPKRAGETRTQGFFARDPATGVILLMHSGLMGGGVPGLTRSAFYAWSGDTPIVVARDGAVRTGVIVAVVGSRDMVGEIAEFVRRVSLFKQALAEGLLDRPAFQKKVSETKELLKEFVGTKSGKRAAAEFSYETYHGAVVEALHDEREATLQAGEKLDKTILVDLFVTKGGRRTEVWEVKSKTDRQSLYGAIGQLVTHGAAPAGDVVRTLVVPEGPIAKDIEKALAREDIAVRRYRLVARGRTKRVVLL